MHNSIQYAKDVCYAIISRCALIGGHQQKSSHVLIVRVDEIGDYILWRPSLRMILQSELVKQRRVTLIANSAWKSLYSALDSDLDIHVVWVDKGSFKSNPLYRYRLLRYVRQKNFEISINPTFSRDPRFDDAIVSAASSTTTYGFEYFNENYRGHLKEKPILTYTHVCNHTTHQFELERNNEFALWLNDGTGNRFPFQLTQQLDDITRDYSIPDLPDKFAVIFPGSRNVTRKWPCNSFAAVAEFLHEQYNYSIVICGGPSDVATSSEFKNITPLPCVDLTGSTSLPEFLFVLSKASLLVSVDTGAFHLSSSVGCRTFGIFNGSQYGRFSPYPKSMSSCTWSIYPEEIENDLRDPEIVRNRYTYHVDVPYSLVTPSQVMEVIASALRNDETSCV